MAKKNVFKTDFAKETGPADPEALFRDLKGRDPEIKHLWSHQADILRAYHENHAHTSDVALELPTGAGKTLVGLLIGEFRRRTSQQRVAYLCPTRQLAHQVGKQAKRYGIAAHVFVGKQRDYPVGEFSEYEIAGAIGITTYSAVFNTNPRIDDAQTIILDDAHAAESYIGGMWSLEVARSEKSDLYNAVIGLFANALPPAFVSKVMDEDTPDRQRVVEAVPGKYFREKFAALQDLMASHLSGDEPAGYSWQMVRDHLHACSMFICKDAILIRPVIPPSMSHAAFSGADQRICMSATLGLGGELERVTGIRNIERIPVPIGWDNQGTGRRLFVAPFVSLDDAKSISVGVQAMKDAKRSLALAPNQYEARKLQNALEAKGLTVIGASQIEDSVETFTGSRNIVLLLSRYDGLDLPDEACRVLAFSGLPAGTNLQERFLMSRLAASSLLRDRILTRFTQGVGRCTRSDNDYAVVLLLNRVLADYILKPENRSVLHPELQAELEFGIENSKDKDAEGFQALQEAFLEQGDDWGKAEKAIVALREKKKRLEDPVTATLGQVVGDEVDYLYAMWSGDCERALEKAKAVSDALGGNEIKGYRGWWYYLAGDASLILHEEAADQARLNTGRDYFRRAGGCCLAISWFARLARSLCEEVEAEVIDELTPLAVEAIRNRLQEWGLIGKKFEDRMGGALADIRSDGHRNFHRGLDVLGQMLGFEAEEPKGSATPDCVWSLGDALYVVHEAKTEHTPDDAIGVNDVRQAQSHVNWVKANRPSNKNTSIVCVMETPRECVNKEALPHANTLCRAHPNEVRALTEEIMAVLRSARSAASGMSDEAILEDLMKRLQKACLCPANVASRLSQQQVKAMPQ